MALIVNTNIKNDTDQYLLDAKNVKGGYVVVATVADMNNLPAATTVQGSLCFCVEGYEFYQYDGSAWQKVKLVTTKTSELTDDIGFAKNADLAELKADVAEKNKSIIDRIEATKVAYATRDQVLEVLANYGFVASDFNDVILSENNALTFSILPMLKDDGNLLIYPLPVLENERLTF